MREVYDRQWKCIQYIEADIILGACRSYGQTVEWWENTFKDVEFLYNEYKETPKEQEEYCMSQLEKLKSKIGL